MRDTFRADSEATPPEVVDMRTYELMATPLVYPGQTLRARVVAARLSRQTTPGDRTILLFPPGLEFIVAFFQNNRRVRWIEIFEFVWNIEFGQTARKVNFTVLIFQPLRQLLRGLALNVA